MGRHAHIIRRKPRWQKRLQSAWEQMRRHGHVFTAHPAHLGEGYGRHLLFTLGMSGRLLSMALLLVLHGFLPFLFSCAMHRRLESTMRLLRRRVHRIHRETVDPLFEV